MLIALERLIEGGQKIPNHVHIGLGVNGGGVEKWPKNDIENAMDSCHKIVSK